jgi:uncharacterized SAM-binding protein YcdF (DUF218 family)
MRALFGWVLLIGAAVFIFGFWDFADKVRSPAQTPPRADAIVALTGGGLERLTTGVRLLREHKGDRLLISGVNRLVTDNELYHLIGVDAAFGKCCIDIGRSAEDTLGNASEAAQWARQHNFRSIILVTDDYHMPRSYAELSLAMPEAEIHRYPVRTRWTDPEQWRSDPVAAGRLGAEYVKFLVIEGREALIDLGRGQDKPQHP